MKGFPNQIAELRKLAQGLRCVVQLLDDGQNPRDDDVLGQVLVRAGVAGTGHTPIPVEDYIREQLTKAPSNQSFRTTARGLRELYRLLGFIDDSGPRAEVTDLGRQAGAFAGSPMSPEQINFWRRVIRNMTHAAAAGEVSHPYQVLLRLVARRPGITRAKCALALEARNDSPEELDRIVALADLAEDDICRRIGVTRSNWDNAKKVLPKFAEQLEDVVRTGRQSFVLADAPGRADAGTAEAPVGPPLARTGRAAAARAPRTSREVTPETIGRAGTAESFDEVEIPPEIDPAAAAEAVKVRLDRLRRHNLIVRELAAHLRAAGARLYEDPFDILALIEARGILVEVKTLDGSAVDERERVKEALAQLLYYEAFVTAPVAGGAAINKVACFEGPISADHQGWLNRAGIATIWMADGRFAGDALAAGVLGGYLEELR